MLEVSQTGDDFIFVPANYIYGVVFSEWHTLIDWLHRLFIQ